MEFFRKVTHFDFLGKRRIPIVLSIILVVLTTVTLFVRGLNFGLDFTGGTLVELEYAAPVETAEVRKTLAAAGRGDALVQYFGSTRQVMVRLPVREGEDSAALSNAVIESLRTARGERQVESISGAAQRCLGAEKTDVVDCQLTWTVASLHRVSDR